MDNAAWTPPKAKLAPVYFEQRDGEFDKQMESLQDMVGDLVELLDPLPIGKPLPADADAALFPQILGEAYRRLDAFKAYDKPIVIITSEFGTMQMWDWEIIDYLRCEGVDTIAPYSREQARQVCAALGVRRQLCDTRFLVFQDDPGEGEQPEIFKRFYWWEDECTQRLATKFGITIERRSFKALADQAHAIGDAQADAAMNDAQAAGRPVPQQGLEGKPMRSAYKMYLAIKEHLDADPSVRAVGINCLNESRYSDTTPCLAWDLLYQERKMIWGCEADTMAMISKYLLHHSLDCPIMMTNLYPFLMGQAALKHEKIAAFPDVAADPANHVLVAHCGYMGVIPRPFATDWELKPKVLAIVNNNAHAIDARLPTGPMTLAKLHPSMDKLTVAQGELLDYAQFPGSDCVNGGVLRVADGHRLMNELASHHYLLMTGHQLPAIRKIAPVFGLSINEI